MLSFIIWVTIIVIIAVVVLRAWDRTRKRMPIADTIPQQCPECGCGCSPQARFCPDCGKSLSLSAAINYCSTCGVELVVGAMYCPDCGKHVKRESPAVLVVESRIGRYVAALIFSLLSYFVLGYAAWFLAGISAIFLAERIATVYLIKGEYPTMWRVYGGVAIFAIGLSCGLVGSLAYGYYFSGPASGWAVAAISGAFLTERVIAHNMKGKYPFRWEAYSIITRYTIICLTGLSYGIYNSGSMYSGWITTGIVWFITALCAILLAENVIAYRKTGGDASK